MTSTAGRLLSEVVLLFFGRDILGQAVRGVPGRFSFLTDYWTGTGVDTILSGAALFDQEVLVGRGEA
ncbi:MAG: hypothetical protein HQ581_21825 [Planctomycetes bacterium]|nr:hypothetical protein [Planctomycetota bacterium]